MQIDVHHGATYVVCRIAGLSPADAAVVAHAAQYVDDATNDGIVSFHDGSAYSRISSAHKMLDYRNFQALAASKVWLPFHFLPGHGGLPAGESLEGERVDALICRPDSWPARDMMAACVREWDAPWALHRLGIALHTFADTWAHQGFCGVNHEINGATEILVDGEPATSLTERLAGYFVGSALPLGHGTVLSFPDRPWLRWSYRNGRGERVERDNPADFLQACQRMTEEVQAFVAGASNVSMSGMSEADRAEFAALFEVVEPDAHARHAMWMEAVAQGRFSFGAEEPPAYIAKGPGSWKHEALGTEAAVDAGDEVFVFGETFRRSHWRCFHDALQLHRFEVVHRILPTYGIQTA